jgi:hypothetical protein
MKYVEAFVVIYLTITVLLWMSEVRRDLKSILKELKHVR